MAFQLTDENEVKADRVVDARQEGDVGGWRQYSHLNKIENIQF